MFLMTMAPTVGSRFQVTFTVYVQVHDAVTVVDVARMRWLGADHTVTPVGSDANVGLNALLYRRWGLFS
jgi:hypothetical protein